MHTSNNRAVGSTRNGKNKEDQAASSAPNTNAIAVSSNPALAAPAAHAPLTKRALVLELLRRDDGVTLPELMAATGWQAHSVRAVLTGLRKSGIVLEKSIRNGATCYERIEAGNA